MTTKPDTDNSDKWDNRELGADESFVAAASPKQERELAELLAAARKHKITPEEIFEQRVSFVYSSMCDRMTKDEVRAELKKIESGATISMKEAM